MRRRVGNDRQSVRTPHRNWQNGGRVVQRDDPSRGENKAAVELEVNDSRHRHDERRFFDGSTCGNHRPAFGFPNPWASAKGMTMTGARLPIRPHHRPHPIESFRFVPW